LLLEQFRLIVRDEIAAALAKRGPKKLLFTTEETAAILNVDKSWLATKARAGLVPCRMLGHYRYFAMSDIESIIDNGSVPMVYIEHDGQGVSADSKTAQAKSSKVGGDDGDHGDDGGALGEK
jgi:hypothetical protein